MKNKGKERDWISISLRKELIRRVDEVINSKKYGYTSRQDFVTDQVRKGLHELGFFP